jgi:hypothetical protein
LLLLRKYDPRTWRRADGYLGDGLDQHTIDDDAAPLAAGNVICTNVPPEPATITGPGFHIHNEKLLFVELAVTIRVVGREIEVARRLADRFRAAVPTVPSVGQY